MRIRKQASKLLGWAYHSHFSSSASSTPPLESDGGELQCKLNLSPWDAINDPHFTISKEEFEAEDAPSETQEKEEEKEEIEKEEIEKKAEEKESETAVVMKCKKTDGKRWRCNRAAKLPHSLCSYHLTQLRTYRARFDHQISGNRRKNSSLAADSAGTASNYYYYYSILGPWWGKRRGPINGDGGSRSVASNDDTLDSSEESESSTRDGDGKNGHEDGGEVKCDTKRKRKRVIKRRGRKPVKSRSLKSLL